MLIAIKTKFKDNPLLSYALSICATWAGIGSLMNGVAMTQTYGIVPSVIWVLGNTLACIVFGLVALKIPKVREVFNSRIMKWICGIMCVFQAWLSMNGMQTVFADTAFGSLGGTIVAYALALGVTIAALLHSRGGYNVIGLGLEPENMKTGIWKAILLLPGPFTYPYFFRILDYNDKNEDGARTVNTKLAFTLGGIFFGVYMAITFLLAWAQFTPALNMIKAVLITIIGTSTLSSSMYSIYIAFGKKVGLGINAGLILGWQFLIPLGVMGMWTLMASVRIYFVGAGILAAVIWYLIEKRKAVRA